MHSRTPDIPSSLSQRCKFDRCAKRVCIVQACDQSVWSFNRPFLSICAPHITSLIIAASVSHRFLELIKLNELDILQLYLSLSYFCHCCTLFGPCFGSATLHSLSRSRSPDNVCDSNAPRSVLCEVDYLSLLDRPQFLMDHASCAPISQRYARVAFGFVHHRQRSLRPPCCYRCIHGFITSVATKTRPPCDPPKSTHPQTKRVVLFVPPL